MMMVMTNDNDGGRVDANHPVHCPSSYCHSTAHTPHICFPMFDKHCPPCLLELFQIRVKRVITRGKKVLEDMFVKQSLPLLLLKRAIFLF